MTTMNRVILLAGLASVLTACNFPGAPEDSIAEPVTATAGPQEAPSATPSQAPTLVPATPSPSPSPTPVPPSLHIAYVDGGNLWALEPGSAPVRLTSSGGVTDLRLADDGELIVYMAHDPTSDTTELRAIAFNGEGDRLLIGAAGVDALYPLEGFLHYALADFAFVPGSHRLLFNTQAVFELVGLVKNDDLIAIDLDSGELTPLLGRGEAGDFTFSPDGEQLALVRPDSVGYIRVDGTDLRPEVLTFPPVITYSEYSFYPRPVWSPESDSVLVTIPNEDPFFTAPGGTVRLVPTGGETPRVLASIAGDLFLPQSAAALISPDGTTIAYLRAGLLPDEQELVLYRYGTGESFTADVGMIQWEGWAPDSIHFAYAKGSGLDLFLGEVGQPPRALGSAAGLRWMDEGDYLYLSGTPGDWTLTLGSTSGDATPLTGLTALERVLLAYDFAR